MTNHRQRVLSVILAALLLLPCLPAVSLAAPEETSLRCLVGDCEVLPQEVGEELYLFLPASADLRSLIFRFAGEDTALCSGEEVLPLENGLPADLTPLISETPEDGVFSFILRQGEKERILRVMRS